MQNLKATTSEVVHLKTLWSVHYKPLQEVHSIRYSHVKKLFSKVVRKSWHLGFVVGGLDAVFSDEPLNVMWVKNPYKDRWFADPFILDVSEKNIILLVEEFRYSHPVGRIARLTIDIATMTIVNMDIIIETGSHLSFPNILREDGKILIYPENANAGRQDIYEYDPVSHKASFAGTICNDCIWDATISDYFGKRMMFTANKNDYFLDIYEWSEKQSSFVLSHSIESEMKST